MSQKTSICKNRGWSNEQKTVTEKLISAWRGRFRCNLCGYKFRVGDKYRFIATCGIKDVAGGNPLVCEKCDNTDNEIYAKWNAMHEEWKKVKEKFWWFLEDVKAEAEQEYMNKMARERRNVVGE